MNMIHMFDRPLIFFFLFSTGMCLTKSLVIKVYKLQNIFYKLIFLSLFKTPIAHFLHNF